MTYSILAIDPETGELGSAVASCSLAVGGTVCCSRYGVGIVNTQHYAHLSTGQRVLDEIDRGRSPQEALDRVLVNAEGSSVRQFLAIDTRSARGVWTGDACQGAVADRVAATCVAAGNMLVSERVVDRVVEAFERAEDEPLGERLLLALEAGERSGGDRRGRQAAAVLTLPPPDGPAAVNLDLRVDDHSDPLRELRRLHEAFRREFDA